MKKGLRPKWSPKSVKEEGDTGILIRRGDEWAWRLREGGMNKLVEGLKAELRRTDINKLH